MAGRVLKIAGFTWIELLMSLTLFALLLLMGIPYTTHFLQKNQAEVIKDEIKSAIRFSRLRALSEGQDLVLMPMAASNDWSGGMQLMKRGLRIFEWHWASPQIHVRWQGFQSNHFLRFAADVSRYATNGSFFIQSPSRPVVTLVVNRLGRVQSK